ncbi:hypothetical protein [Saccharopolyspora sp. NPDC050642]|uniref:hypothetical protein n=1 Tax=Saccharopolyspora sp. NPDC050642 TaxID=3157099 RepID=UPI0033CE8B10
MSDQLTAWLRTTVPAAWSALVAYLVTAGAPDWLTGPLGAASDVLIVPVVLGAVYALVRAVESHLPVWAARLLLGSAKQPVYTLDSPSAIE